MLLDARVAIRLDQRDGDLRRARKMAFHGALVDRPQNGLSILFWKIVRQGDIDADGVHVLALRVAMEGVRKRETFRLEIALLAEAQR